MIAVMPLLMLAAAPDASIGYFTAGQLADRCSETSQVSASYCFAFIAAVRDTARAYEIWIHQREFCMPPATTQADLRRVFLDKVSAEPASRQGQAASVILVALKQAYPCPVEPPPPPEPPKLNGQ